MFNRIKSWFNKKKNSKQEFIQCVIDNNKKINEKLNKLDNLFSCKKHPEYVPIAPPKNNCNDCWEYYSKGHTNKWM